MIMCLRLPAKVVSAKLRFYVFDSLTGKELREIHSQEMENQIILPLEQNQVTMVTGKESVDMVSIWGSLPESRELRREIKIRYFWPGDIREREYFFDGVWRLGKGDWASVNQNMN